MPVSGRHGLKGSEPFKARVVAELGSIPRLPFAKGNHVWILRVYVVRIQDAMQKTRGDVPAFTAVSDDSARFLITVKGSDPFLLSSNASHRSRKRPAC